MRFSALIACCCLLAEGVTHGATVSTNHYIVTCRPDVDAQNIAGECQNKARHVYRHALRGFAATLTPAEVKKLKKDKRVLAVELDGRIELCEQTNPTGIIRMGLTNFPLARINGLDERIDVDVAVLDTGIQTNHPDLNVMHAVDVTGDGYNGDDWEGHGTKMAGVIGALDNDFGVVGVAPGVRLWAVQIYGPVHGLWSHALAGMDYVAMNADKIAVVNASFGAPAGRSNEVYIAVKHAFSNLVSRGVVVVAAAGNSGGNINGGDGIFGTSDDILPAALPEVMTVSAMDPVADAIWEGSNYSISNKVPRYVISPGLGFDVTAPGVDILSTDKGTNYVLTGGTSAATAHVSGLVALYIAANGRATNAEGVYRIRQAIVDSAQAQSEWHPTRPEPVPGCSEDPGTLDPDCNREPLAFASESWIPQPRIVSQGATTNGFELSFTTVPGYRYTPQHTDTLTVSNLWNDLAATNGTGAPVMASDPVLNAIRYYRVKRERAP